VPTHPSIQYASGCIFLGVSLLPTHTHTHTHTHTPSV
jgi:hypothetical protein